MSPYLETLLSSEVKKYIAFFVTDEYPYFIDKYIETDAMQRLSGIGQFCGCDYTKLYSCKFWYSRLHHSIVCALMAYHFTHDKIQTLAALFHDLGTPVFSHCVDYLKKDYINQESAERNVVDVIHESGQICAYLEEDNISIDRVSNLKPYTILENEKPKLCIDRLDGILHTAYIWLHFWTIEDVKNAYNDITVLQNENGEEELGFQTLAKAEDFFSAAFRYSMALQENKNKYAMQFFSDNLKTLIEEKYLTEDLLYKISEEEVLNFIERNNILKDNWHLFSNASEIIESNGIPKEEYYVQLDVKKRYVVPLIQTSKKTCRLDVASDLCTNLLKEYLAYTPKKYAYISGITMEK